MGRGSWTSTRWPAPNLSRADPPSSECPHATCTRAGRVLVAPHRFEALSVVAALDGPLEGLGARFIDLPEGTEHLAIERPGHPKDNPHLFTAGYEVRAPSGALSYVGGGRSAGDHVLARPERYYIVNFWHSWSSVDTGVSSAGLVSADGERLACTVRGDGTQTLVTTPSDQVESHWAPLRPDYTEVDFSTPRTSATRGWAYRSEKILGVGAIDGNGNTVIALESGRLLVVLPRGDNDGYAVVGTEVDVDAGATDLSIVPPFAMVLYGGGAAGTLVARRDTWPTSRLDARRPDGSLAWRTQIAFRAGQPPIDGNGRVYVVGTGIVALDMDGKTVWSIASPVPMRAQAFSDGTLAVVHGAELQIVGTDGVVKQSFRAEEELTSYPAIGSDGAVWVASAKTLYVAR